MSSNGSNGNVAVQTEFEFSLPKGYVDRDGTLHRQGMMRLATANDEIAPLRDPRVRQNQAYMTVILLSRVITRLGTMTEINPNVVEGVFSADLMYLQDFYRKVNSDGTTALPTVCPECGHKYEVETVELAGGY
ncbi:MAG TPA: phage tail assembly protein [Chloroflexota bacterium]|nr:phage tail assembly protein [Chloroflexota bacterium]